jgi:hypothetical protein
MHQAVLATCFVSQFCSEYDDYLVRFRGLSVSGAHLRCAPIFLTPNQLTRSSSDEPAPALGLLYIDSSPGFPTRQQCLEPLEP